MVNWLSLPAGWLVGLGEHACLQLGRAGLHCHWPLLPSYRLRTGLWHSYCDCYDCIRHPCRKAVMPLHGLLAIQPITDSSECWQLVKCITMKFIQIKWYRASLWYSCGSKNQLLWLESRKTASHLGSSQSHTAPHFQRRPNKRGRRKMGHRQPHFVFNVHLDDICQYYSKHVIRIAVLVNPVDCRGCARRCAFLGVVCST